jgi:hypothetical protein
MVHADEIVRNLRGILDKHFSEKYGFLACGASCADIICVADARYIYVHRSFICLSTDFLYELYTSNTQATHSQYMRFTISI